MKIVTRAPDDGNSERSDVTQSERSEKSSSRRSEISESREPAKRSWRAHQDQFTRDVTTHVRTGSKVSESLTISVAETSEMYSHNSSETPELPPRDTPQLSPSLNGMNGTPHMDFKESPIRNVMSRPKRPATIKGATKQVRMELAEVHFEKKEIVPGPELEKRRSLVVAELLSTEITYVNSLKLLVEKYAKPIREHCEQNRKSIPPNFIENTLNLFVNAENLLPLNENFRDELQKKVATWDDTTQLGETLQKFLPFLKLYTDYSNNYDAAIKAIEEVSPSPWFAPYAAQRIELESFLITPIQRIPRYSMLLQDLWNHTLATHPDHSNLEAALATCKNVADHVNSAIELTRNSEHLTMLGLGHLLEAHRRLLLEGTLEIRLMRSYYTLKQKKIKKQYCFFLFNDLLVFIKVRKEFKTKDTPLHTKNKTIKIKQLWDPTTDTAWPLELVWLRPLDDKTFEIIGPMKTLTVRAKELNKWYNGILENVQAVLGAKEAGPVPLVERAAEKLDKRIGIFNTPSGEIYEGEWDLGRMHGYGVTEFHDTYYEGQFELNLKSGHGKMEYADGQIYEGEWRSGKPQGQGTSCTKAGDKYVGEWSYGKRDGQGEMIFWNGDSYLGEWKDNNIEGSGTLKLISLNITYSGNFVGGKFHGGGTLTTYYGTYTGMFELGRQTGEGRMEYANHDIYNGSWKNGLRHGQGKLISQDGLYVGQWAKDLKEGKGRMEYCDGSTYEGSWCLGKRHGKGVWSNPNNPGYVAAYSGDWVFDTREGTGELQFNTGDKFIGPIVTGQPHGHGKMVLANGRVFEAKFNNGIMEGKVEMFSEKGELTTLETDGQICGEIDGVEVLVPPFLPVLHFY